MSLTLQRDLDRRNVAFDHDFFFKSRSLNFKALITRYRGTNCVPAQYGVIVTAWQKSIYRFGGIPLEETIVATILVRWDGKVHGVSLDRRSHGGLGAFRSLSAVDRRFFVGSREPLDPQHHQEGQGQKENQQRQYRNTLFHGKTSSIDSPLL